MNIEGILLAWDVLTIVATTSAHADEWTVFAVRGGRDSLPLVFRQHSTGKAMSPRLRAGPLLAPLSVRITRGPLNWMRASPRSRNGNRQFLGEKRRNEYRFSREKTLLCRERPSGISSISTNRYCHGPSPRRT